MRLTAVPDELKKTWFGVRFVSYMIMPMSLFYPAIGAFMASRFLEGTGSVFDWTGMALPEAVANKGLIAAGIIAAGIGSLVGARMLHRWFLNRPLSSVRIEDEAFDTPQARAMALYFGAKLLGLVTADVPAILGLLWVLLFGGVASVGITTAAVSLICKVSLLPTETQLLQHLESAEGESNAHDVSA